MLEATSCSLCIAAVLQTSRQVQLDLEQDTAVARLGRLQEVNLQKSLAHMQTKLEKAESKLKKAESRIQQLESDLQTAENMDKQTLWLQYVDTKSRLHKSQVCSRLIKYACIWPSALVLCGSLTTL